MFFEIVKFIIYSGIIVLVSKFILVTTLRKLAEVLELKPKTIGNIAGYATSVPELLTICVSSLSGLMNASIINILSSNVINLIQYLMSIYLNKNQRAFQNQAIKVDLILVLITIIIPILLIFFNIELNLFIVPLFIILYLLFLFLNGNVHKLYLQKEDKVLETQIEEEEKATTNKGSKSILYIFYLILTAILLFVVGNLLGDTLENLCITFKIPQVIIGILLGFITSIPELITFIESQRHYNNQNINDISGVVEATNNLFTSNILNLFVIQTIGIIIFSLIT